MTFRLMCCIFMPGWGVPDFRFFDRCAARFLILVRCLTPPLRIPIFEFPLNVLRFFAPDRGPCLPSLGPHLSIFRSICCVFYAWSGVPVPRPWVSGSRGGSHFLISCLKYHDFYVKEESVIPGFLSSVSQLLALLKERVLPSF